VELFSNLKHLEQFSKFKGSRIEYTASWLVFRHTILLRKIVGKTKIHRIRSQKIRESCGIQPTKRVERRRRYWDAHVTRMDAESLVKISRNNISAEDFQEALKEDGAT
jgi:hypothetical protein